MRELNMYEVKKYQLGLLDVVAAFYDERGINYWLNAVTLLGAVRHKGYIPWDDDIDLGMLRHDYDRFMNEFRGTNPRYEFHCIENDPKSEMPYGKVTDTSTALYTLDGKRAKYPINIDIFPMDNAPDEDGVLDEMFAKRDAYRRKYYMRLRKIFSPTRGSILRKMCVYLYRMMRRILCLFPARFYYVRKMIENSKRYASEDTRRVGDFTGWHDAVIDKQALMSFVELEFEGKKYKAPAGYDEWLRTLYDDYMQLPPIEERVSHHDQCKAYAL